jgi:hypothetical protein
MVSTSTRSIYLTPMSQSIEINDFGYPQNSEIDTLKTYITTESIVSSAIAVVDSSILPYYLVCSFDCVVGRIVENHNTSHWCDELAA